jgi:predicted Zn-dependent peptidase
MPVSDAELDEAKQAFDTSIDELAASNESLLNLGKQLFVTERKPDWARGLREQGRAITAADLLLVARKYLRPKAADIGVYGSVFVAEDLRWVGNLVQYRYELR